MPNDAGVQINVSALDYGTDGTTTELYKQIQNICTQAEANITTKLHISFDPASLAIVKQQLSDVLNPKMLSNGNNINSLNKDDFSKVLDGYIEDVRNSGKLTGELKTQLLDLQSSLVQLPTDPTQAASGLANMKSQFLAIQEAQKFADAKDALSNRINSWATKLDILGQSTKTTTAAIDLFQNAIKGASSQAGLDVIANSFSAFQNGETNIISKLQSAVKLADSKNSLLVRIDGLTKKLQGVGKYSNEAATALNGFKESINQVTSQQDLKHIANQFNVFQSGQKIDLGFDKEINKLQTMELTFRKLANKASAYYLQIKKVIARDPTEEGKLLNLIERLKASDFSSVQEGALAFQRLQLEIRDANLETQTWWQRAKDMFSQRAGFALIAGGIGYAAFAFRDMYKNVVAVDTAMTELKKVTNETAETYARFLDDASARAQNLGATLTDVINATANFARLGYTIPDSTELADVALIYKNVADGIDNIDEATEAIISTMKAFGIETSDSMRIVDAFNEVGNKFAITSEGIGEALKRSASALKTGGNTMEESIGLITAANAVVQDPEKVGTSLKTVSMYLRAAKADLEDVGESTDGMASSTAVLREKLLALSGVDIMLDDHTFKSTYQILKELSDVWDDLSKNQTNQAAILELIGGKRNANVNSALLINFADAEKAYEAALNSMGSATTENAKYLDSIQGRLDKLAATWQAFSSTVLNADAIKFSVTALNGLLTIINEIVDGLGVLPTLGIAIFTAFSVSKIAAIKNTLGGVQDAFAGIDIRFGAAIGNKTSLTVKSLNELTKAYMGLSAGQQKVADGYLKTLNVSPEDLVNNAKAIQQTYDLGEANIFAADGMSDLDVITRQNIKTAIESEAGINAQVLGTQNLNYATVEKIITDNVADETERKRILTSIQGTNANNVQTGSYVALTTAIKGYLTALWGTIKSTAKAFGVIGGAPALVVAGVIAAIAIVRNNQKKLQESITETAQKFDEANNKYEETKSELESLSKKYDELYSSMAGNGYSSGSAREELATLDKQITRLKTKADLYEKIAKFQQKTLDDQVAQLAAGGGGYNEYGKEQWNSDYIESGSVLMQKIDEIQGYIDQAEERGQNTDYFESQLDKYRGLLDDVITDYTTQAESATEGTAGYEAFTAALAEYAAWIDANPELIGESTTATNADTVAVTDLASAYKAAADAISLFQSQMDTLGGIQEKLLNGTVEASDLVDLFTDNPELAQYADDYNALSDAVGRLIDSDVNKVLSEFHSNVDSGAISESDYQKVAGLFEEIGREAKYAESNVSDLTGSFDTLSSAFAEQNQQGGLSIDTLMKIVDSGYAAALSFNAETGAVTLNQGAVLAMAKAKIEARKADLMLLQTDLVGKLNAETKAARLTASAWLQVANANYLAAASASVRDMVTDLASAEAELAALDSINLDNVVAGLGDVSSAANDVADAFSSINSLLDMTMEMLKQRQDNEKEALEDEKEQWNDYYDEKIKDLEEERDAYLAIIDARKAALEQEKETADYEKELTEKQTNVAKIQAQLLLLQNDDSIEAQKQRLELSEDLNDAQSELDEYQADHEYDLKQDALDKERDAYEDETDNELDLLKEKQDSLNKYYENAIDKAESYYESEATLREAAYDLMTNHSQELYNMLIEYNRQYGDGLDSSVDILFKAYTWLEKYGWEAGDSIVDIMNKLQKLKETASNAFGGIVDDAEAARRAILRLLDTYNSADDLKTELRNEMRLAEQDGDDETYQKAKQALKYIAEAGFSEGGVTTNTGLSMLHGTTSSPEVIFNAKDAAKLYEYVHNSDDLIRSALSKTLGALGISLSPSGSSTSSASVIIGDIIVQGNADAGTVEQINQVRKTLVKDVYDAIANNSFKHGIIRKPSLT